MGVGIAGIVGTSEATLGEARRKLETRYGIETPGFASLEAAIEKAQPDMVAICSPNGFHRKQLEITARAGLHCLCEKPLWWSDDQADSRAITKSLVAAFTMRNRLLDLVTQWPFTLPSFDVLHGNAKSERLQSFEMILSPRSEGEAIIPDCIPHVWSLLYAVAGGGEVRDPTIKYGGGAGREVTVWFRYAHATGDAAVTCRFVTTATKPSPAAYAINGRWMHRQVRLPDYGFEFESNGRTVPADDPLDLLVADFIRRMHAGELTDAAKLVAAQLAVETVARMTRIE